MTFLSRRIGVVLIDLSGTLHIEEAVIPGAIEALKRLREAKDIKLKFVTNTTKECKETLLKRLTRIGFCIEEKEIFTSLTAANELILKRNLRPFYLLSDDALKDFKDIPTNDPNVVVVGLDPASFGYETMTKAFRLILDGASLLAIHKGRYHKRKDGLALGPGAYISALEYATGVKAEVVGKPESCFFLTALKEFGEPPEDAIMIGDDARDDIEGASKAGIRGCLVRTGKYRPQDENNINPPPAFVAADFVEAVDFILKNNEAA